MAAGDYDLTWLYGDAITFVVHFFGPAARIVAVTNTLNPTVTTDTPHGVTAGGGRVHITEVTGAEGVNGGWLVLAVLTSTTFTIATPAPGEYEGGGRAGKPLDTTGYTARLEARAAPDAAALDLELTTANGGIILSGADGRVEFRPALSATAPFTPTWRRLTYAFHLIAPSGAPARWLQGSLVVRP